MNDSEITRLLNRAAEGDSDASDRAWRAVYEEVRAIAHRELARRGGATLSTTGLIHEAYVKLAAPRSVEGRGHFYALACRAMRQVLVDRARHRDAAKRGGGQTPVTLDEPAAASGVRDERLLELDEALERLSNLDPRLSGIVECRFFGGLTVSETAETMGLSLRTAEREWERARTHLYRMLQPDG